MSVEIYYLTDCFFGLVGNIFGCINEVKQRQTQLVLGWVIIGRQVNYLSM